MSHYSEIIERCKNQITQVSLVIGALAGLILTLSAWWTKSPSTQQLLLATMVASTVMLAALAISFYRQWGRAMIRRYAFPLVNVMLWISIFVSEHPDLNGAYQHLPILTLLTSFIAGNRFGIFSCLANIALLILLANRTLLDYQAQWQNLDAMLFVDRIVAQLIALTFGLVLNRALRETIKDTDQHISELQKHHRLTALGIMVGGMAHEINNPLQIIDWVLKKLQRDKALGDQQRWLAKAKDACQRIRDMTNNLLFYSDSSLQQLPADTCSNLRQACQAALLEMEPYLSNKPIQVHVNIRPETMFRGRLFQLQSIVASILANAVDALEAAAVASGELHLELKPHEAGHQLCISNNGPHIDESVAQRIFDPFFTTKEHRSGIGLYSAFVICQGMGWGIHHQSNDQFTCFSVIFPADAIVHVGHNDAGNAKLSA